MGVPKQQRGRRVAIACQGGGSHTAFTAGVLRRLLADDTTDVVALSGTSGGAVCALLAWHGLVTGDREAGARLLAEFWNEMAATDPFDSLLNASLVATSRLEGVIALPAVSPYLFPAWAQDRFRRLLRRLVPEDQVERRTARPLLLVGAVDVLSGEFVVFSSSPGDGPAEPAHRRHHPLTTDAVLASAAIPNLFRAVPVDGAVCWDGLFSQNPPVRDLPDGPEDPPDELWVVRINPERCAEVPTTVPAILDRRNELAGNLSLRQELDVIEKMNELVRAGKFSAGAKYRTIAVRTIDMAPEVADGLDAGSKLDRRPALIEELVRHGEHRAGQFLAALPGRAA